MSPVRILPHVRGDQVMKMVVENGLEARLIKGHTYLMPRGTPVIPLFLRRQHPATHQPEPPQAA